ncbi:GyrI-like domain-containing protein [Chloroflexi bacterium TSY]|nr:GyrI-like domain-containing protein [Chloroflexi bacterium TSY]
MEPVIIEKPEFTVVGAELNTSLQGGQNAVDVPKFTEECLRKGIFDNVADRVNPAAMLGIAMDFEEDQSFTFVYGVEVDKAEKIPAGLKLHTIPTALYAVFTTKLEGPDSIIRQYVYIGEEWLPNSSQYKPAIAPGFEVYDERSRRNEGAECDIYVPVIRL